MSIIQVLVGFGLAAILGLAVAEMGNTSSKQAAQVRASLSRASLTSTLQSVISSNAVCSQLVNKTNPFQLAPAIPGSIPGLTGNNIAVSFRLDTLNTVADGVSLNSYGLTTEWIRAFEPTEILNAVPAPQRLYVTDLKMKVRQNAGNTRTVDLKFTEVGKAYFVTTGPIGPAARIANCFGTIYGNFLCPNENDIQTIQGGSWTCTPAGTTVRNELGKVCPSGTNNTQMIKGVGGTGVGCEQIYKITNANCEGVGAVTADSQCSTRACGQTVNSTVGGGGYVDINVPGQSGGNVCFPDQSVPVTITIPGSGTRPASASTSTITIPGRCVGAGGTTGYSQRIPVQGSGASISTQVVRYLRCNNNNCDLASPDRCNNSPTF
ncbi:hypothetical protein [Bdellovibrio sp. GT3]|uniref:hypothetical protein n=1 Tax=Bdellovibrio sp. GT3 TaxID=3136282 RepID=UPI0030F05BC7